MLDSFDNNHHRSLITRLLLAALGQTPQPSSSPTGLRQWLSGRLQTPGSRGSNTTPCQALAPARLPPLFEIMSNVDVDGTPIPSYTYI
jgi:hypothetical protein